MVMYAQSAAACMSTSCHLRVVVSCQAKESLTLKFDDLLHTAGAVAGVALRAIQALFLEQTVPFTYRRHTVVLPVGIELLMGDLTFKQQVIQQN